MSVDHYTYRVSRLQQALGNRVGAAFAQIIKRAAVRHQGKDHAATHRARQAIQAIPRDAAFGLGPLEILHRLPADAGTRTQLRLRHAQRFPDRTHPAAPSRDGRFRRMRPCPSCRRGQSRPIADSQNCGNSARMESFPGRRPGIGETRVRNEKRR